MPEPERCRCAGEARREGRKRRLELLDKFADNIEKRDFACSDNFDKAILTYASAGLGLSLILYRDFIPHGGAGVPPILAISWIFFTAALLAIIFTYLITPKLLKDQKVLMERYLLHCDETARRRSSWEPVVTYATIAAGALFFSRSCSNRVCRDHRWA